MLYEDPEQQAVLADDSPRLLITAPPGSGKTVTAVRLAARDVDNGTIGPTQKVLVLTFSLHARAQLEAYAKELLTPEQRRRIEISNYHSWFWRKIWHFRSSLGLPLELELMTEKEHEAQVLAAMVKAGVAKPDVKWNDTARDYGLALEYGIEGCLPDRLEEPLPDAGRVSRELVTRHRGGQLYYDDLAYYMWRLVDESKTLRRVWHHKYPVVILDEYQDASPIQAKIIERLAGQDGRIYAFADRLQMIYEFRDASPKRVEEFEAQGASGHTLRTLHRYKDRPNLRVWMEGVRDVLLVEGGGNCPAPPAEVNVIGYDPNLRSRGDSYDFASRELWQLDGPISNAFKNDEIRSIAVLHRNRKQLERVERHLSKKFFCKRLRTASETSEWAREWLEEYARATNDKLKMDQLMEVALRVAPGNEDLGELAPRIDTDGIRTARLGERRRELGEALNAALSEWTDLAGACAAARRAAQIAASHADDKLVAGDAAYVVRTALRVRSGVEDPVAREKVIARLSQLRFSSEAREPRGLYLLTCHESKGKEFDMVILPFLTEKSFKDDDPEARQLLYVSLTRCRRQMLVRVAHGEVPGHCTAMGLKP